MFWPAILRRGPFAIRVCGLSLFVSLSLTAHQKETPACQTFDGTTPQAAVAYLQQDRATLEPGCVDRAISIVRKKEYTPAIKALRAYIDFEKPVPPGAPRFARLGPTAGIYPAADALGNLGGPVIPDLREIIRSDDSNTLSKVNAAKVYFFIDPSPSTVAFVARAAQDIGDRGSKDELAKLAQQMVKYCPKDKQEECKKALSPQ